MKKPPSSPSDAESARALFQAHGRDFQANRYVYPVLSRRAGGISIGVNVNRDKACNFDCVYCQVDRTEKVDTEPVDLDLLATELQRMVELVTSGRIFEQTKFRDTPPELRRFNDIAISGDGEPTLAANFIDIVKVCAKALRSQPCGDATLVLITNATLLHQDRVRRALEVLDEVDGRIWAKLDAGTEDYYRKVARSTVPFQRILDNLTEAAQARPIVIQSLFMRINNEPPPTAELEAYCDRLNEILAAGGQIESVQIHTIARTPAESFVAALTNAEVDAAAELVRKRSNLRVAAYHGTS
ncbi:MAG TPA: radical SAM protein [Thermoguttaceae bacterium]|nr:radical SAM protein [Thermoguttaceae bacterium]